MCLQTRPRFITIIPHNSLNTINPYSQPPFNSQFMTRNLTMAQSLDHLPTPIFEKILNYLDDEDIPALHLVSRDIYSRVYEYIRHGREWSRIEREKCLRNLYSTDLNDISPETQLHRNEYVRQMHVALKTRFYALTIVV